jgi:hypothetical protein
MNRRNFLTRFLPGTAGAVAIVAATPLVADAAPKPPREVAPPVCGPGAGVPKCPEKGLTINGSTFLYEPVPNHLYRPVPNHRPWNDQVRLNYDASSYYTYSSASTSNFVIRGDSVKFTRIIDSGVDL